MDISGLVLKSVTWLNDRELDLATAIRLSGWLLAESGSNLNETKDLVRRAVDEVVNQRMTDGLAKDSFRANLNNIIPVMFTRGVNKSKAYCVSHKLSGHNTTLP